MDAKLPTYNELQRQYQDTLKATVPGCDADDPDGFFHGVSHALAQIDLGQTDETGKLGRNAFRGTADRAHLVPIAEPEIGAPTPATSATFTVTLRGDADEAVPTGIELLHEDTGVTATTTAGGTFDGEGLLTVAARSEAGTQGRFRANTALRVINPPAHVTTSATVATDAIGGTNEEDTEDYRSRDLDFVRRRPAGGKEGDLAKKARTIAGVVKAVDFPELDGYGTHGVAVCGENNGAVPAEVVANVDTAINARDFRIGAIKRYFALNSTPRPTDVTVEVALRSTWAMSDIGGDKVVQSGSTKDMIYLDYVTGLAVDKWIAIAAEARKVISVGANYVTVDREFSVAPAADTPVWPGGPFYETMYGRVLEMIYNLWPGDELAPGVEGDRFKSAEISDFRITAPATTVHPIVNADTVEIITPGTIRIMAME